MKQMVNKRILMAAVSLLAVWTLTAGIAYGANLYTKSLNAQVNIVGQASFSFYADDDVEHPLSEIKIPDVSPGGTSTFIFYLKNTSPITERVFAGPSTVPQSVGLLTLRFDGQTEKILAPGAVCKVICTLTLSNNATAGLVNFAISVNAEVVTGTGTTTPPPPATTLTGQQLFAANCTSCHSGRPNTSLTQTQLLSFIPGHRSGLTTEQVAAIAVYIRP